MSQTSKCPGCAILNTGQLCALCVADLRRERDELQRQSDKYYGLWKVEEELVSNLRARITDTSALMEAVLGIDHEHTDCARCSIIWDALTPAEKEGTK